MSFSAGAGGPALEGGGEGEGEVGELGEPVLEESLQALLEEGDEGGAGRRRGREGEPSAEAGGEEPPAKVMRSPVRDGGGGDGLGEAMSLD